MSEATDRIALISDLHGNLPALEVTLADIRARGISRIFCLGDLVGKGPSGAEIIERCQDACDKVVQGNWDALTASEGDNPVRDWHRRQIGPARLDYLRGLPPTIEFYLSGRAVRLFHASEKSIFHRVHMYDTRENHLAMFESTEFTGNAMAPDLVGYGDIHVGYVKSFAHKSLFNVGSVGNPLDITQACYAVLEGRYGSREHAPWTISLIRVPYDIEEAVRQAERAGMPELDAYAMELRTARYRGLTPAL